MIERSTRRSMKRLAVAATIATTVASLAVAISAPADAATQKSYPGAVPSWAKHSADAGTAAADTTVEGEVYLALKDEAGAQQFATAVSTPGTSKYGKFLSPSAWIAKYAPTKQTLTQVENYLKSSGFTISAVPKSREYVVFRGPAQDASAAFGTKLHRYRFAGHTLVGPSSTPTLPAAIGKLVSGVSVDNGRSLTRPSNIRAGSRATAAVKTSSSSAKSAKAKAAAAPSATAPIPSACSDYYGENTVTVPAAYGKTKYPTDICGYLPSQLRSGYGLNKLINSGTNGQGETIAITDAYASPTILQDTNDYMRAVGSPLLTTLKQNVPKPSEFRDEDACGDPSGWQPEEAIDVQSAHSVAPGANILYVGGFNCGGGLDIAVSKILDDGLANIVSNSWGDYGEAVPDDVITGEQNQHIQAAGEGIGLYFSSGDNGDEVANIGYASPDFPASSPFVTSVGGTSLAVGGNGAYQFETGWGSTRDQILKASNGTLSYAEPLPGSQFRGGAGGGTSAVFAQPAYQKGVVPNSLALAGGDGQPARVSPDVAALADPYTGFQIALRPITDDATLATGPLEYDTYGGTSLASPITAAEMALAQQLAGRTIGFANPAVYALYRAKPSAFHDITPFSPPKAVEFTSDVTNLSYLVTLDRDTTLTTAPGYDDVTGVGSLNLGAISQLASSAGKR
jgi:subtilase family serine protease